MDDATVISIHLANGDRLVDSFGLLGHPAGQFFEILLACIQIAFHIHQHANPLVVFLIDYLFNQILDGFQGLPAFADEQRTISAFHLEQQAIVVEFALNGGAVGDKSPQPFQCLRLGPTQRLPGVLQPERHR